MAFRDDATVLREKLETAESEIATLRERNMALRSQQMPAVRWLSLALGVTVVLGAGIVWHLGTTNRGLNGKVRAQQANVATLRQRGFHICGPALGRMASGLVGAGRMEEPADILGFARVLTSRTLVR